MKLFGFKRHGAADQLTEGQLRFAGKLAGRILSVQRRLADYLNRVTRGTSPRSWMMMLCCFCLLAGAYLLYLLAQVFN